MSSPDPPSRRQYSEWYDHSAVTGRAIIMGFCGGSAAVTRPAGDAAAARQAAHVLEHAYR